ncbi:MAG TPA: peptidylprolyl isomerase [Dehalococcoidia bacterium]|nr:peptidylprolyl isomerase [Dehalococcoidia bacterium]
MRSRAVRWPPPCSRPSSRRPCSGSFWRFAPAGPAASPGPLPTRRRP